MKNFVKNQTSSYVSINRSCNVVGCSVNYTNTSDYVDSSSGIAGVNSVNNKKLRPWSNYSYHKWTAGGGSQGVNIKGAYIAYPPPYYRSKMVYYDVGTTWTNTFWYTGSAERNAALADESYRIALAKLLSSMKDERTQWNAAIALGEGRETARQIARTASRLYHGYLSFRKGDLVNAYKHLVGRTSKRDGWSVNKKRSWMEVPVWDPKSKKVPGVPPKYYSGWAAPTRRGLDTETVSINIRHEAGIKRTRQKMSGPGFVDDVSDSWMEFSFAWTPLLKDIDSAAKYLAERRIRTTTGVYRFSRKHACGRQSFSRDTSDPNQPQYVSLKNDTSGTRITCEARLRAPLEPSTIEELGFTDPATTLWNLLPLSFVVDWFVNVNQVLESLHEFNQWTVKRCLYNHRDTSVIQRYLDKAPSDPSSPTYINSYQFIKFVDVRRELGSLPTSIPLRIKVDNPFNLQNGQLASLAVLLRYAFTGTKPSLRT